MAGIRINRTIRHLKGGGLIIFGTDTVNGIGCLMDRQESMERIFEIKNRDRNKPLILLMSDYSMVNRYMRTNTLSDTLMRRYMPGALTLVLDAQYTECPYTMMNGKTAFRIPSRRSLRMLIKAAGKPIASTSLNISGDEILTSRNDIKNTFPQIPIFNNITKGSQPSTIIDASSGHIKYIRKGNIIIRGTNGEN